MGTGLLIRISSRPRREDGFQAERTAALRVTRTVELPLQGPRMLTSRCAGRVREVQGIEAAGLTDALPLGRNRSWGIGAKGQIYPRGQNPNAFVRVVSDGYMKTMGIQVRAGRELSEQDTLSSDPVIMINDTMAHRLWPGEDAIGKIVRADRERRVVGVVWRRGDTLPSSKAPPRMYLPIRQSSDFSSVDLSFARRSPHRPPLRRAFERRSNRIAPDLPANDFRTCSNWWTRRSHRGALS